MKKLVLWLAASLLAATSAQAQIDPMQSIPADPAVRTGRLENGMSYYIRHNKKPKGQADFYILHDVGAIQENDAQQGLAHFLEHMAFNGTKNLPNKQLIEYLEKIGVKFGSNLNASTGWDATTYLIRNVPTSREGIIDSALMILHDWSHFIALRPEEIDSERGVIMEELRTRDGAAWRSQIEMIRAVGRGTKYEHRNIIGYLDGLKSFDHKALEEFYHTWYRPDYQAVIVVGDIDVDATEQKIQALMADIAAPAADAPQKELITVPDNEEPIVTIFTDPEQTSSAVNIFIKRPALPAQAAGLIYGEMFNLMLDLFSDMASNRLQELAMQPDAPFLQASLSAAESIGVIPTLAATVGGAATQNGKLAEGFEALYTEMERVRRFGFTAGEFERAQQELLRSSERQYTNRNDVANGSYVRRYINHFQRNTPIPDAETEWQLDSLLLNSIPLDAVNMLAQQLITPTNQVWFLTSPEKEGVQVPTEAELLAIRDRITATELEAHEDTTVREPLIADPTALTGSPIVATESDEDYGATVWTLANGARVVVKPTTFRADEIRLSVQGEGGLSLLADEDVDLGSELADILGFMGVGRFSAMELNKQLAGKSASVNPGISQYGASFAGSCSPKDLETMLQLLYLSFEQPRFDEADFQTVMRMLRSALENLHADPSYIQQQHFIKALYGDSPRRRILSLDVLDTFRFERIEALYRTIYPGAKGFTFLFVGNVDVETLRPLVEKYIGSIREGAGVGTADDGVRPVRGHQVDDFTTPMQQPKVGIIETYTGNLPYTLKNQLALNFLTQALRSRYLISIREEKGGTYGVGVGGQLSRRPEAGYQINISFDTNEEMADELRGIVREEIERIAAEGPLTEDVEKHREYLLKTWTANQEENGPWMGWLAEKYAESGLDIRAGYEAAVRALTGADIQALARELLAADNHVEVVMRPAKGE